VSEAKPLLRLIGDVHGRQAELVRLAAGARHSVCLGDVGFDYRPLLSAEADYSPQNHKIVAGNHDNYDVLTPHFLGDFGTLRVDGFGDLFFVRGGRSIDAAYRTPGVSWWHEEQLNYTQSLAALAAYREAKPTVVLSHECPASVIPYVSTFTHYDGLRLEPSHTALLLDAMLSEHQPLFWYFGHYHVDRTFEVGPTQFRCLAELSHVDLPEVRP
jgi:hypothetical protein